MSEAEVAYQLVLDTSVAVKFFLPEDLREEALVVLSAMERGEVMLLAPSTLQPELFNALWQQHRRHTLSRQEVRVCWGNLLATPIDLFAPEDLMPRAAEIALETGIIVYDALFLALAEDAATVMHTADDKLINALGSTVYTGVARHLKTFDSLLR